MLDITNGENTPLESGSTRRIGGAFVNSTVHVVGTMRIGSDMIFDGTVEGELISEGALTIGEQAKITGDVTAKTAIIHGTIDGNLTATERCVLKSTAVVKGDVSAPRFSVEESAVLEGSISAGCARATTESNLFEESNGDSEVLKPGDSESRADEDEQSSDDSEPGNEKGLSFAELVRG